MLCLLTVKAGGKCGAFILLGMGAAFDTVVHDILLNDLESIGVGLKALKYLKS